MYTSVKRLLDIVLSLAAMIFLSPILLPVCVILRCTGEHHIFYLQKRVGYKNRHFFIWKFATMLLNSPNLGTGLITVRNDPRVLPFGKLLRKTKVNELPQLVNIFIGDMSVVGPRPLADQTFDVYPEAVKACINDSRPGLTGLGQIMFRDEEDYVSRAKSAKDYYNTVIAPYKGELEMWYLKNKSLYVDLMIVLLTVWVLLFPRRSDLARKVFKGLPFCDLEEQLKRFNAQGE